MLQVKERQSNSISMELVTMIMAKGKNVAESIFIKRSHIMGILTIGICVCQVLAVFVDSRKPCWIPLNCNYSYYRAAMWVMGTKARNSARKAIAPNCNAIFPASRCC